MRNGWRKRVLFSVVTAVLMALLVEGLLQIVVLVSDRVDRFLTLPGAIPRTITDRRVVTRPNPAVRGHDARGFRNPTALSAARIVAFGDSQTYGTGVKRSEAWPQRLAALLGDDVYGMAYGGWAPAHSLALWDEAAALSPEVVIEAFYSGNDLYDCFRLVHEMKRADALLPDDPETRAAVERAEGVERLTAALKRGRRRPRRRRHRDRTLIERHSRLYALGFKARRAFDVVALDAFRPLGCEEFESGDLRTVLTPAYRHAALDQSDVRLREGLRIVQQSLRRMNTRAEAEDVRFVVVLIPTKELVFADVVDAPSTAFTGLVAEETAVRAAVVRTLEGHGIEHLDLLPALRAALASGRQPYKTDWDGHPNAIGHQAIAEAVAARIE